MSGSLLFLWLRRQGWGLDCAGRYALSFLQILAMASYNGRPENKFALANALGLEGVAFTAIQRLKLDQDLIFPAGQGMSRAYAGA